jgi:predicted dehydrogenase
MRAVVTGVSHWHAARYLAGFRKAGAAIVAVEDADPALAQRVADELGCRAYAGVEAMLDAAGAELAIVLGEPARMAPAARAALARGVPIVAEKPLGLRAVEVDAIAQLAEGAGVFAAVAFVNRMRAIWGVLAALGPTAGPLSHLAVRIINGPPARYRAWNSGWMLDPARSGGGALHNLGIHGVDAFLTLTGADPEAVRIDGVTLSTRAHREPIEDYGLALLRAPDGLVGIVEAGYVYPSLASGMTRGGDSAVRVASAGAYLVESDGDLTVTYHDGRQETRRSEASYEAFCQDTVDRLRDGRPPLATPRDCARAVRLLERIYAAHEDKSK